MHVYYFVLIVVIIFNLLIIKNKQTQISRQINGIYNRERDISLILENYMKKLKIVAPFYFKDKRHEDTVDLLNAELPINLKYNEDLINRIYDKYPLLDKASIGVIVKSVFQSIREFLILGNIMNFNNIFFDTKLLFYQYLRLGKVNTSMKVKMSTPPPLRKL